MKTKNNKCCQGCKKGQLGQNKSCQAKLMKESLSKHTDTPKEKTLNV